MSLKEVVMEPIEEIIKLVCENEIQIPNKIEKRIQYTLQNKRKPKHYLRNFITTILSILGTLVGTFCVYAATGGTIEGIPAADWFGIKFSSQYVEYKQPVENQVAAFGDTSVELTSTLCSEGITILEFDVKLSQEDYNNFQLGKTADTEGFYQKMQELKEHEKQHLMKRIQGDKYSGSFSNETDEEIDAILGSIEVTEEEMKNSEYYQEYLDRIKQYDEQIEERKTTGYRLALALNTEQKGGTYTYDKFNPNMDWYASIYIDDTPYYVRNWQKVQKISDYEYKIFTMYSLTDDELQGKENFKITLKNNKLVNQVAWKSLGDNWLNDCQGFANEGNLLDYGSELKKYTKDLLLDFEVNVSKDAILKDSKVIENPGIKSEFRNITQTVEKVVDSPIQTIVKINHSASKQASNAFANKYPGKPDIEHLPMTREYKVYDANGKELTCFAIANKNTLIYANGTREDYDSHDIPSKKYTDATWETIEYLLIEKTETDFIKIVPVEIIRNPVSGENDTGEILYEMEPLIIHLK